MSGLPGRGQLTSDAGSLGPRPGTTSSLCSDPPTCAARARHSFGSAPRAIHHRLSTRRPTFSQEAQTPHTGGGRVRRTGCSSTSCPLVSWMPSRQAVLRRKVAQLAGQVCLSSNRTQEEAQGVLTPSCWPGCRHPQRWEPCLQAVPRRCRSRAESGVWADSPLPPCSELTLPLPPQQETGPEGSNTHPTRAHPFWARTTALRGGPSVAPSAT